MPEADSSGASVTAAAAQEAVDLLPPEINTSVAHSARVYNYWLGGCFP
jgi:S-adenosyl methyltransferase